MGAIDPSKTVRARIQKAVSGCSGGKADAEEIAKFIIVNNLDEHVKDAVQLCTPEEMRTVIDRGGLLGARDPTAVVMGRIRDVKNGDPKGKGKGKGKGKDKGYGDAYGGGK